MNKSAHGSMLSFLTRFGCWRIALLGWMVTFLLVLQTTYLTPGFLSGWDTAGHAFLTERMVGYLKSGRVSGYNPLWLGGYPEFSLYPPGAYLVAALPHFLSLGAVSVQAGFNFWVCAIPFFIVAAFALAAHRVFGGTQWFQGVVFGFLFLTMRRVWGHAGIGLGALVENGLFPNFIALPAFILLLGEFCRRGPYSDRRGLVAGGLFGILLLTHTLSSFFAACALALLLLFEGRRLIRFTFILTVTALAISGWWILPFLTHLPYASAISLGLTIGLPDPLFSLFPGLSVMELKEFFSHIRRSMAEFPDFGVAAPVIAFIAYAPYRGALLLLGTVVGIIALAKEQRWYPAILYILTLLLLPRFFLAIGSELGVHYHRMSQGIWIIEAFIAGHGVDRLAYLVTSRGALQQLRSLALQGLVAGALVLSASETFNRKALFGVARTDIFAGDFTTYRTFEEHPGYHDLVGLGEFLTTQHPTGRIIVESDPENLRLYGSPHAGTVVLAARFGLPSFPGLLAESSLGFPFTNGALAAISKTLSWGAILYTDSDFYEQPPWTMLRRLAAAGGEYIVSTSEKLETHLREDGGGEVEFVKSFGRMSLYRFRSFRPLVARYSGKPLVYLNHGEFPFLDFSKQCYRQVGLLNYAIISGDNAPEINRALRGGTIGGVIINQYDTSRLSLQDLQSFRVPVLFVNGAPAGDLRDSRAIQKLDDVRGHEELEQEIKRLFGDPGHYEAVPYQHDNERELRIASPGWIVLTIGTAPGWRLGDTERVPFTVQPASMMFYSDGPTLVSYR